MKKEELKLIFEKEFDNIKVSKELKQKTLKNIEMKNNVFHFPVWIKNCVAVFIVTCICLSYYLITNNPFQSDINNSVNESTAKTSFPQENNTDFSVTQDILNAPIKKYNNTTVLPAKENSIKNDSLLNEQSPPKMRMFAAPPPNSSSDTVGDNYLNNESIIEENFTFDMAASDIPPCFVKNYIDLPEEELLKDYPNAEKTENGYIITEGETEILYKVANGIIIECIMP